MSERRHRPWLGGVCARGADVLGWNVYGLRGAAVLLLWLAPLLTGGAYLLAAWWLRRERDRQRPTTDPTLAQWDRRMAAINREWERCQRP